MVRYYSKCHVMHNGRASLHVCCKLCLEFGFACWLQGEKQPGGQSLYAFCFFFSSCHGIVTVDLDDAYNESNVFKYSQHQ